MKKALLCSVIYCLVALPVPSKAFWGNPMDTAYLAQIVANALKQLYELQKIVEAGKDQLGLIKDINRGINDSMRVIDSIGPYIDPGVYKELRKIAQVAKHLEEIYGIVVPSKDAQAFRETDSVASEAITLNNELYDYANDLDKLAENIKDYSHHVSPGGAQKLTAQTLGVLIHAQNQHLRATGTGLKLQAQSLLLKNKKEKEEAAEYLKQANRLSDRMKSENIHFEFPRF